MESGHLRKHLIVANQSLTFLSGQPFFNQITAERMNLLANRSIDEIVGGMASQTPGRGWRFVLPRKIQNETRCYVVEGTTATSLPGLAPLDAINFDVAGLHGVRAWNDCRERLHL